MTTEELATMFNQLTDETLVQRASSGGLTEQAQAVAEKEVAARQLALPVSQTGNAHPSAYQGDLVIVARQLTATEAHMLSSCLNAAGVPAEAGDTNFVQMYSLLIGAVGGANVRVPANFVDEACAVIAAYQRGEFALGEDFNVDELATHNKRE